MKKYTEKEILFLSENYPKFGSVYCANNLNRKVCGIKIKSKKLGLKYDGIKKIYLKENLELVVMNSNGIGDVLDRMNLRKAGGNYAVIRKYITKYKLDTSHFVSGNFKMNHIPYNKMDINDMLVENSTCGRGNLKKRLYKEGILERICCFCGQDENWMGKKISLILDHKNGIYNDNRRENLRIVCPNCNASLDTFARIKNIKPKEDKCSCGNLKSVKSTNCKICSPKNNRKTTRPPFEELKIDINMFGYKAVGRKYGVSDNAIRKWMKQYENNIVSSNV
jgi:hypothetical protein